MIHFVHGPDRLLAREAAQAIAAGLDPDGGNITWLDGRETSFGEVAAAVGAASFFGLSRIVVVTDLLVRFNKDAEGAEPATGDQQRTARGQGDLESLIAAVPESHHLIFLEPSLASVPAAVRSSAGELNVFAAEPPRGSRLVAWIEAAALETQSRIDRRAAQRLAERLYPQSWDRKHGNPRYDRPPDLARLRNEIEKLALAAHPGAITTDHVESLTAGGPEQRIFRFLDSALGGDLQSSVDELDRLTAAGEEPAMLLAQLLGQIELATVAEAATGGNADALARDLGTVAAGRMSAVLATTRRRASRSAAPASTGVVADRRLKSGRTRKPADALHDLVLALATPEAEGPEGGPG